VRCHLKMNRIVTRDRYEREMFEKAGLKLGLTRTVLKKKKKDAIETLLLIDDYAFRNY